jgi:16S rRNA C967 or C1407 C5-methylase (RsmB/RsmF family)/NOL1/NOP2/fmu family ribosome biogenesis protein
MKLKTDFLQSIEHCQGFDKEAFIEAHHQTPVVSIRINQSKTLEQSVVLDDDNLLVKVPWCDEAYVLKDRPSFTLDPLFHAGAYYVQEASSMFLQYVAKELFQEGHGYKALDLCAAPGGKSTLMAGMHQFGMVISNEIIQSRVAVLQENIIKWGQMKVLVSNNDPADFKNLPGYFDFVMVDAPCSGSGLFRKDDKAMNEWNPELVDFCAARQKRILLSAIETVAVGGYLFYSTCSFSEEENEDNLDFLIDTGLFESVDLLIDPSWNIISSSSKKHGARGYRFYPDKILGEGFFCSVLKKVSSSSNNRVVYPQSVKTLPLYAQLKDWVNDAETLHYFQKADDIFAFDSEFLPDLNLISTVLKLRKSGLRLGEIIREEFVPNHELAMSTLQSNQIPSIQLDLKTSLQYLRRETIETTVAQKGWSLVQYKGISLGWIKQVQGKAKNHYPLNWRILMRG